MSIDTDTNTNRTHGGVTFALLKRVCKKRANVATLKALVSSLVRPEAVPCFEHGSRQWTWTADELYYLLLYLMRHHGELPADLAGFRLAPDPEHLSAGVGHDEFIGTLLRAKDRHVASLLRQVTREDAKANQTHSERCKELYEVLIREPHGRFAKFMGRWVQRPHWAPKRRQQPTIPAANTDSNDDQDELNRLIAEAAQPDQLSADGDDPVMPMSGAAVEGPDTLDFDGLFET